MDYEKFTFFLPANISKVWHPGLLGHMTQYRVSLDTWKMYPLKSFDNLAVHYPILKFKNLY